jgi:ketosteroid isomerase-like protein
MGESNAELARRGYEAVIRGDLDAVKEFLDPNVKWHGGDPTARGACRNRDQALEFIARAVEGSRVGELVEVKGAGAQVLVIMRPPTPPGGQPRLTANVTTFRDGRAVEIVHYPNPEDAAAAVALSQ